MSFQIGLHKKDLALLELIKAFFGVGTIGVQGQKCVQLRVYSIEDLEVIISHFDKYPLLTKKCSDYILFKKAFELVKRGEHLNSHGLREIVSIKAALNKGLSDKLPTAFPVVPALKPEVEHNKISDLH